MTDSPKDEDFFERAKKTCVKFKRDVNRRRRFVEILLLVGTITAAFNKSAYIFVPFIVFFLVSIIYYILIEDEKEHFTHIYIISIFISITFVGILLVNLVISLHEVDPKFPYYFAFANPFIYFVCVFVFASLYVIFQALSPSR
jgi:hypothetical protein